VVRKVRVETQTKVEKGQRGSRRGETCIFNVTSASLCTSVA